ncbi:MAG: DUF4097 family beta strand repeat-containing protein [Longimicrobiales bacterium]
MAKRLVMAIMAVFALTGAATAQERLDCDDDWSGGDRERFCEVREIPVAATGRLDIDGGLNGGVSVVGWDRDQVLVQAKVTAWADDAAEARSIAAAVEIATDGGRIEADGPRMRDRTSWGVSYLIHTPRRTDLRIETHNGGIGIAGVEGRMTFEALNGGVALTDVAGDVQGETTNGGVSVRLTGDRWRGAGLDVETTNGGVRLEIPDDYSARLVTGTVNGGMDVDFPITVQGRIGRRLETTLGQGGPTISVRTTNGGVRLTRR